MTGPQYLVDFLWRGGSGCGPCLDRYKTLPDQRLRGGEEEMHREREKEIRRRRKRREKALKRRVKELKARAKKA